MHWQTLTNLTSKGHLSLNRTWMKTSKWFVEMQWTQLFQLGIIQSYRLWGRALQRVKTTEPWALLQQNNPRRLLILTYQRTSNLMADFLRNNLSWKWISAKRALLKSTILIHRKSIIPKRTHNSRSIKWPPFLSLKSFKKRKPWLRQFKITSPPRLKDKGALFQIYVLNLAKSST